MGVASSLWLLAGCQTTLPGPYPWAEGWREATVLRTEPADKLSASAWVDCREALSPETVSKLQFAEVEYHDVGGQRRAITLIRPDSMIQAKERVVFNVKDCTKALEAQAKKAAR